MYNKQNKTKTKEKEEDQDEKKPNLLFLPFFWWLVLRVVILELSLLLSNQEKKHGMEGKKARVIDWCGYSIEKGCEFGTNFASLF